jgi:hypothetical protein
MEGQSRQVTFDEQMHRTATFRAAEDGSGKGKRPEGAQADQRVMSEEDKRKAEQLAAATREQSLYTKQHLYNLDSDDDELDFLH